MTVLVTGGAGYIGAHTIRALAARGHEVLLAAEEPDTLGGLGLAESLAAQHPRIRVIDLPPVKTDAVVDLGTRVRVALDYFRFHDDPYAAAPKLRERLRSRVPRLLLKAQRALGRRRVASVLSRLERSLPPSPPLTAWLQTHAPDVLLLGSMTHYRSPDPELHRAAAALGIPTGACIYSWDHLSSKALLRRAPEAVFVWNDVQADEATRLHAMPASRVLVTGAQCYDHWYAQQPSRDHEELCRAVGLDADCRYVLYVCSALTPSPDEPGFVRDWIQALRSAAHPAIRDLGILIRPHPERAREWADVTTLPPNVVVHGGVPASADARRDFFDAVYHADAVVGLVTSAFLDAAIIGRPVFTITLPQFARHQHDMQHFRYLLEVAGGLPAVADNLREHVDQLGRVLDGDTAWRARQDAFVRAFIRPHGDERAPTARFVDGIERLKDARVVAVPSAPTPAARLALRAAQLAPIRRAMHDALEAQYAKGLRTKVSVKLRKARSKRRRLAASTAKRWLLGRANFQDRP